MASVAAPGGRAAAVQVFNVFAGPDVLHGVDRVLLPGKQDGKQDKPASGKPASPKRRLLQSAGVASAAAFAAENAPGAQPDYLQRNTQSGFLSDNPALTYAAANTASALRAGTDGQGRWQSYLWYGGQNNDGFVEPTNANNPCYNCGFNAPEP